MKCFHLEKVVCVRLTFALCLVITTQLYPARCQRVVITPVGNQMATTDSDVTLTCSLLDYRPPTNKKSNLKITWYRPDSEEITKPNGRTTLVKLGSAALRLTLARIEEGDGGKYRCQATDTASGLRLSNETTILVYEDIGFEETPTLERVLLGSTAFLQCRASGLPKPEISWYFNNRLLLSDAGKFVFHKNGLSISDLDLRDGGMYECRAEVFSNGNSKSRYISLDILFPPVVMRPPAVDSVIRGQTVTLQCKADGNPPVKYEWLRDQKVTDLLSSKVIMHQKGENYTIQRVDSDDEGRYYCRVSNDYGSKEMHVDIKMMIPPSIKLLPSKIPVLEGQTASVTCEASGTPVPGITWNQTNEEHIAVDKEHLIRSGKWLENLQPGLNSLLIRDVDRSLTGSLHCLANNLAGSDAKTTSLIVEYRPTVSLPESEVLGWAGEVRSLRCQANGVPPPTVTWLRDQQPISSNYVYHISYSQTESTVSSQLTIRVPLIVDQSGVSTYGVYECIAKNVHGIDSGYGRLNEAVIPDMVRNVSVLEETPTTVTLRATPPSASAGHRLALLSWRIKYELVDRGPEPHIRVFNFSSDNLVVTDLNPATTYTFYLSVSNAVGYSNPLKFRVATPKRPNLNQQSDVPGRSDGDDDDDDELENAETKTEDPNAKPGESRTEVVVDHRSLISHRDTVIILAATAIGILIVILSIVTAVVCVSWRKKKLIHRHHSSCHDPPTGSSPSSSSSSSAPDGRRGSCSGETRLGLHPMWKQPNGVAPGALPDIVRTDCVPPPPRDRTPKVPEGLLRGQHHPIGRSGSLTYGSFAAVAAGGAWRKPVSRVLVQHQQRSFDDSSFSRIAKREPLLLLHPAQDEGFDLPPPPAFLLYPVDDEEGGGGGGGGFRGQPGLRAKGRSHGELLGGYRSGDNVDDDIDNIDYTIRLPSVHSQMFNYS